MKSNQAVYRTVDRAVYDALYWTVPGAVAVSESLAVYDALFWPVWRAMGGAALNESPHPSLDDFLTSAGAEAP